MFVLFEFILFLSCIFLVEISFICAFWYCFGSLCYLAKEFSLLCFFVSAVCILFWQSFHSTSGGLHFLLVHFLPTVFFVSSLFETVSTHYMSPNQPILSRQRHTKRNTASKMKSSNKKIATQSFLSLYRYIP